MADNGGHAMQFLTLNPRIGHSCRPCKTTSPRLVGVTSVQRGVEEQCSLVPKRRGTGGGYAPPLVVPNTPIGRWHFSPGAEGGQSQLPGHLSSWRRSTGRGDVNLGTSPVLCSWLVSHAGGTQHGAMLFELSSVCASWHGRSFQRTSTGHLLHTGTLLVGRAAVA